MLSSFRDFPEYRSPLPALLSGSALKVLAILTMTIDHLAGFWLKSIPAFRAPLFTLLGKNISWLYIFRMVGRLAFPIFAFLIVEGFFHTRNRRKYALSLLAFAFISEIPWNLVHCGHIFFSSQNVLFTLFLGLMAIWVIDSCRMAVSSHPSASSAPSGLSASSAARMYLPLLAILAATWLLRSDYGFSGVAFIVILYLLRDNRMLRALVGCGILPTRWIAGLAFIPIGMYNGRRGFIHGTAGKYFFYLYYPLHLLLIYLLATADVLME